MDARYVEDLYNTSIDWVVANPDLSLVAVGLTALLCWTAWMVLRVPSTSYRGITRMGKKRTKHQKEKILSGVTNAIEGEVLFNRMTRIEARLWYAKLGVALGIEELIPVNIQATKGKIKHRLKMNGHDPVIIPGGPLVPFIEATKGRTRGNLTKKTVAA